MAGLAIFLMAVVGLLVIGIYNRTKDRVTQARNMNSPQDVAVLSFDLGKEMRREAR